MSSSQNKRTLGEGGGGEARKRTRANKGEGESKLENLERMYFLSGPIRCGH